MSGERGRMEQAATRVRNRDIPALARVLCVMQDVRALEERRAWQRERMYAITQHLTGMPGGGAKARGMDDAFSRLSELDEAHEEMCRKYVRELKAAERILNRIGSRTMRTFVVMKYVLDMPNTEIMRELNMSKWGFERARRCVEDAADMERAVWRERYITDSGAR